MHLHVAAKSHMTWIEALCLTALLVPLSKAGRLSLCKCWLGSHLASVVTTAYGTARPLLRAPRDERLPFILASWALPLSLRTAVSTHSLWCFLVLAVVPVASHIRRYGSKPVVQADPLI